MEDGIATPNGARYGRSFTRRSARWTGCSSTRPPRAPAPRCLTPGRGRTNICWSGACSGSCRPAKQSTPRRETRRCRRGRGLSFRRCGSMTCYVAWNTCAAPVLRTTTERKRPSALWWSDEYRMGGGCSMRHRAMQSPMIPKARQANRVAGTRFAPCGCWTGLRQGERGESAWLVIQIVLRVPGPQQIGLAISDQLTFHQEAGLLVGRKLEMPPLRPVEHRFPA